MSADIPSEIWTSRKEWLTSRRGKCSYRALICHASMTIRPKGFTTLSGLTRSAVSRRHRTARMAVTKSLRAMAKQMMEISTSKTVSNNLGNYNSRTFQGKAWTQREYEFENEKGLPGRQYGVRDWSRASLNFEVVKGQHGQPIVQPINHSKPLLQDRWQKRIDEGYTATVQTKKGVFKKPIKKSEIKMVMIDFGGNRDRMHELAFDRKVNLGKRGIGTNGDVQRRSDIEQWAVDCYEWAAKKYGAENIIDFVVHLDETNPHIHCIIVPLTRDGKLSYTELFGGSREQAKARSKEDGHSPNYRKGISDYLLALHTDFANTVGDKWGLERGDDIKITGNTHKSTAESLKEHNKLEEEIEELDKTKQQKSGSVLTLTNQETKLTERVEELKEAERRADENLTLKNQALAKIGMKPVRPTTEVEDENERLRLEKERAERVAREEKEKATAATEKAKTAYSDGVAAGKHQMESSVTAKVNAAKEEVRQSLPAEIRKMAHFKAVENDSIDQVANGWRWNFDERKKAQEQVKTLTAQMDQMKTAHQGQLDEKDNLFNSLLEALMSIPFIGAAIRAIIRVATHYTPNLFTQNEVNDIATSISIMGSADDLWNLARLHPDLVNDKHQEWHRQAKGALDRIEEGVQESMKR